MAWEAADWTDVTPRGQDDSDGVCSIAYDPSFAKAMDHFRAVVAAGEKSQRVLLLTEDLLEHNPANYSVWHYRRLVLAHLAHVDPSNHVAKSLELYRTELAFLDAKIRESPKNYQVWYHRQAIVPLILPPPSPPATTPGHVDHNVLGLLLTSEVLEEDGKNYHAWAYRQWVVQTYGQWEEELAFVGRLIDQDIRNNSAWNQRFFVLSRSSSPPSLPPSLVSQEVSFALGKIRLSPSNESAWNYLRGVVEEKFSSFPEIKALCLELKEKSVPSSQVISALADIYREENNKEEASQLLTLLETKLDTIHGKFWALKKSQLGS